MRAPPKPPSGNFEDPTHVGSYRIVERLGAGLYSVVYLAERLEPAPRWMALKILQPGMESEELWRFLFANERRIHAKLNHPNVVRCLEAGSAGDGTAYLAMEHIDGCHLKQYVDEQRPDTRERLRLFLEVCRGVQYIHDMGVIHRDIKFSSILVEVRDGRADPKIVDFGLAKQAVSSEFELPMGTAEFTSPEQFQVARWDVDRRADVYSLGVLLYKLLAGSYPVRSRGIAAWDYQPPRPSAHVRKAGRSLARSDSSGALAREISGSLDWIVMKALAPDRTHRYGSVTELSEDIGRYLANEPVRAGRTGTRRRCAGYVKRHRFLAMLWRRRAVVVTAALFAFVLVAGLLYCRSLLPRKTPERSGAEVAVPIRACIGRNPGSRDPEPLREADVSDLFGFSPRSSMQNPG